MMTASILFIVLAFVFAIGKIFLEKRWAHLDAVSDERRLGDLAFSMGCSVYDLFVRAAANWHFSKAKIDADFRDYVRSDRIPPYVQAYLEQCRPAAKQTYQELLYAGGRPPYL